MIVVDDFKMLKLCPVQKCIYIIEFAGCVKIGYTKNIYQRCEYLNASNKSISKVAFLKCDNNNRIEKEMHNIFSDKKIKGEYFNISFSTATNELLKLKPRLQFKDEIYSLCVKFKNYVEFQKKNFKTPNCAIFKEFGVWFGDYIEICSRKDYSFKLEFVEKVKALK